MLFIVRGKNNNTDTVLRIEADSPAEAEALAWKHGMFVTEITSAEAAAAEQAGTIERIANQVFRMWRYVPSKPLICFGKPISNGQSAALIFLGVSTWFVQLHNFHLAGF